MSTAYAALFTQTLPELALLATALAVLGIDLAFFRDHNPRWRAPVLVSASLAGSLAVLVLLYYQRQPLQPLMLWDGMFVTDPLSRLSKTVLIILAVLTLFLSRPGDFTQHYGEYFALLLTATVGLFLMVSSENLLMIFLALELTSLCLYVLVGFAAKSPFSAEAALKYFLFGGVSAASTLFGLSLLYGLAGGANLDDLSKALQGPLSPLLLLALTLTIAGFGFKIAVVPFHLWAPDTYQAAPVPAAVLIAAGSKVASFILLTKFLLLGLGQSAGSSGTNGFAPGWAPVLASTAVLSMILGNLGALVQRDFKRLLAYSAISHSGYTLLGLLANSPQGVSALIFYVVVYSITVLGAFGAGWLVFGERASPILELRGLGRRHPCLAFSLAVFVLSLAGLPPLAGFFGKFYLFAAAISADEGRLGLLWLVVVAIVMSTVSFYYYLIILKRVYVDDAPDGTAPPVLPGRARPVLLFILAVSVIVLGCFPDLLLQHIRDAVLRFGPL